LNTEDLLTKYKFKFSIMDGNIEAYVQDGFGRKFDFNNNQCVWFRKPSLDFDLSGTNLKLEEAEFVKTELKMVIETLYSLPNTKWVNDPNMARKSSHKYQQLCLVQRLGAKYPVRIPNTAITNSSRIAKECFGGSGDLVAKAVYTGNIVLNGIKQGIETQKISNEQFCSNIDSIDISPTCLQNYIQKKFELRIVVIGNKVFAVKIDSQIDERTKVDWRKHTALCPHTVFILPKEIEAFCLEFIALQKLVYGSMDFIVTPAGEYVFLENNPYGQWLWLENMTGIPLTKAFADYFLSIC